jgi:hypothetical protein
MMMQIPDFEGHGRKIMVQFTCQRCKKTALKPLKDCLPSDCPVRYLSDLETPAEWKNGGFYYPTFCPDCAKAYEQFMKGK